jgi:hypothetical protein
MNFIIISFLINTLILNNVRALEVWDINGTFQYCHNECLIINEIVIPKFVDICTKELPAYFLFESRPILGFLTKNKNIVPKSEKTECDSTKEVFLEDDKIFLIREGNLIRKEAKSNILNNCSSYQTTTTSPTTIPSTFSSTISSTSSGQITKDNFNIDDVYKKLKLESSNANKTFDWEYKFNNFFDDVNDIIYQIIFAVETFIIFFIEKIKKKINYFIRLKKIIKENISISDDGSNNEFNRKQPDLMMQDLQDNIEKSDNSRFLSSTIFPTTNLTNVSELSKFKDNSLFLHNDITKIISQNNLTQDISRPSKMDIISEINLTVEKKLNEDKPKMFCACKTGSCTSCVCKKNQTPCNKDCHQNRTNKNCANKPLSYLNI